MFDSGPHVLTPGLSTRSQSRLTSGGEPPKMRVPGPDPCLAALMFLGSSVVEQSAVNRLVGGSNPSRGAIPPPFPVDSSYRPGRYLARKRRSILSLSRSAQRL